MSTVLLLGLVLAASLADVGSSSTARPLAVAEGDVVADRPGELRQRIRETLKRTTLTVQTDPQQAGKDLLALHGALQRDTHMARVDRQRYLGVVRSRLRKVSHAISAQFSHPAGAYDYLENASVPAGSFGGAAVPDAGQRLVELIQQTIAPSSWDVNGGSGTIRYYPPLRVLVVRQTGEGHEQLGGILRGLRGR